MAPPSRKQRPRQTALSFAARTSTTTTTAAATRPSSSSTPRTPGSGNFAKRARRKPNASILNFFQKVPRRARNAGDGLFMDGEYDDEDGDNGDVYESVGGDGVSVAAERNAMIDEELMGLFEEEESTIIQVTQDARVREERDPVMQVTPSKVVVRKPVKGPFMVDDGEESADEEVLGNGESKETPRSKTECSPPPPEQTTPIPRKRKMPFEMEEDEEEHEESEDSKASLKQKSSINLHPKNSSNGGDGSEDAVSGPIDDDFVDDEMVNVGDEDDADEDTQNFEDWEDREKKRYFEMLEEQENGAEGMQDVTPQCPICARSLEGMKEDEATRHVNRCLDGGGSPEPTVPPSTSTNSLFELSPSRSPVSTKPISDKPSAFTHIMSSLSEARAWATAAISEAPRPNRQRRSSLTRTTSDKNTPPASARRPCPFYKMIFSQPISVAMDAFKYGAIPGVEAYFLSHFHSDHYGGLTGSWQNGLIWCTKVTANLVRSKLRVDGRWVRELEWAKETYVGGDARGGGETLWVTAIPANHCPGSAIYLFERRKGGGKGAEGKIVERILHTGDFRAAPWMLKHPLLSPYVEYTDPQTGKTKWKEQWLDTIYLDTTYLNPKYTFPRQSSVISVCAEMCVGIDANDPSWSMRGKVHPKNDLSTHILTTPAKPSSTSTSTSSSPHPPGTLLIVIGTYSIGKERICISIAQALKSKIYAPQNKLTLLTTCLESPLLASLLTPDPKDAQVHMVPLMEIRPETLAGYLRPLSIAAGGRFTRVIGFRPTGWTYKPPKGAVLPTTTSGVRQGKAIAEVLGWTPPLEPGYTERDLVPARGSSSVTACYGVPYSEHSSFRELACFTCGVNVRKVVPTVNVGRENSRKLMGGWLEKWRGVGERRRRMVAEGGGVGEVGMGMGAGWEWEDKEGEGGEEGMFMGMGMGEGVFMGQRDFVGVKMEVKAEIKREVKDEDGEVEVKMEPK